MTPKQRLAFIILQLNFGYTSWSGVLRLARKAACGSLDPKAITAASDVRAALEAAEAAMATIESRELVAA